MFYLEGQTQFFISFIVSCTAVFESCAITSAVLCPGSFSTPEDVEGNCHPCACWSVTARWGPHTPVLSLAHVGGLAGECKKSVAESALTTFWRQLHESYRGMNASGESL